MASSPIVDTRTNANPGTGANYTVALIVLGAVYFVIGFVTCLNDTLVPYFKASFSLTYFQSSLVQFYFFVTYGLMSIPAGRLVGKVGYKSGIRIGLGMSALGAGLFLPAAWFGIYAVFLAALFVLAMGVVLLQVAANPYIAALGSADTASSRLTMIQGLGSVGTTVAPLFGAHFILSGLTGESEKVHHAYIGIAIFLVVLSLCIGYVRLPKIMRTEGAETTGVGWQLLSSRPLRLGVLGIFLYVGAEVTIGTFLTNYIMDELKVNETFANHMVTYYWGGMLAGRFVGAALLKKIKASNLLALCSVLAILLIVIALVIGGAVGAACLIGVGLANSVMFAIIFSLAIEGLGEKTALASGLLSSAIVGGAVMPVAVGWMKDHYDWWAALLLPLAGYVYLLYYARAGYNHRGSNSGGGQ